jgi:hypothetical protein
VIDSCRPNHQGVHAMQYGQVAYGLASDTSRLCDAHASEAASPPIEK